MAKSVVASIRKTSSLYDDLLQAAKSGTLVHQRPSFMQWWGWLSWFFKILFFHSEVINSFFSGWQADGHEGGQIWISFHGDSFFLRSLWTFSLFLCRLPTVTARVSSPQPFTLTMRSTRRPFPSMWRTRWRTPWGRSEQPICIWSSRSDRQGQGQVQGVFEKKRTTANLHLIDSSHVIRVQSSSAVCTVCPQ